MRLTPPIARRSILPWSLAALATVPMLLHAQTPTRGAAPSPGERLRAMVAERYAGDSAFATVAFLDQFVRWPGNRGFDASIDHIAARLEAAGYVPESRAAAGARLTYRVERYPMAAPAWEPLSATLSIVGEDAPVLDFATNRNMLATNSFGTPAAGITAELVDAGGGTAAELDAANVRGKVVMADVGVSRLFTEAVVRRGAVGVLGYALPAYLQPERNRTSIQFGGVARDTSARAWGIALSFAARERLRRALAGATARGGAPVRVQVRADVRWTSPAVERAVIAEVRGTRSPEERFVFSAHVQEPGANDNASGVGAQVEMARVAAALVRDGAVSPDRTITFLWGLEIRSTERYLTQDTVRAAGVQWGLSLDMVGEDTEKTGGTFLIEKMPDPSAIWTRGEEKHSEWGGRPLTKADMTPHYFNDFVLHRALEQAATNGWVVRTNPFEGGSDHTPFLRAKKPGLLFWHFTDQFYHTDGDRIDKVSPAELRNVGITALASALLLTTATTPTALALVGELERAALARIETERRLSAAALRAGGDRALERDILETWRSWYDEALGSYAGLEIGGTSGEVQRAIAGARQSLREATDQALRSLP